MSSAQVIPNRSLRNTIQAFKEEREREVEALENVRPLPQESNGSGMDLDTQDNQNEQTPPPADEPAHISSPSIKTEAEEVSSLHQKACYYLHVTSLFS